MQGRCRGDIGPHSTRTCYISIHLATSRYISPFDAHLLQPAARLRRVDAQAVGEQDERSDLGRLLALPRRAHALLELDEQLVAHRLGHARLVGVGVGVGVGVRVRVRGRVRVRVRDRDRVRNKDRDRVRVRVWVRVRVRVRVRDWHRGRDRVSLP